MRLSQRTKAVIALLLISLSFNTYTMEPEQSKKLGWIVLAGAAIIGGAVAVNKFLSYIHSKQIDFYKLPEDVRNEIISLLTINASAKTLEEAAYTINSLARVNKELNALINEPQRCLQIIKHLAQKFNYSEQTAAKALKTKEAKRRLDIQTKLQELCSRNSTNEELTSLFEQGVILDFTYDNHTPPLTLAATNGRFGLVNNIIVLAFKNKLNLNFINMSNEAGDTPLLICIGKTTEYNGLYFMGKQAKWKRTDGWPIYFDCLNNIKLLLIDGADPELANKAGLTPLAAAQQTGNSEVIDLVQDAIDKKHEKQGK